MRINNMEKVNKNKVLWENIKIIFNNKVIQLYNDFEYDDHIYTLESCLNIAKENGYTIGTILVISESYMTGDIYRYGNYPDGEWWRVGKMEGFA